MLRFFSNKPKWIASPNFGSRGDTPIEYIILHYTDTQDTGTAVDMLRDPKREVSAHYVVEQNGRVIQMVRDKDRAWHAGKAFWRGLTDINAASIGIEIVNPGHTHGHEPFPDKQIAAVIRLCQQTMKAFGVKPENVLAHSDVAPDRKEDPGHLFPWARLATAGIGVYPTPTEHDYQTAQDVFERKDEFDVLLTQYGYDPDVTVGERLIAFHRHFYQDKFDGGDPSAPDVGSVARLLDLLAKPKEIT